MNNTDLIQVTRYIFAAVIGYYLLFSWRTNSYLFKKLEKLTNNQQCYYQAKRKFVHTILFVTFFLFLNIYLFAFIIFIAIIGRDNLKRAYKISVIKPIQDYGRHI
jgi:hypothetical protein